MRRAMTVLIGMWIPTLCWGACGARCPSENLARITIRDAGQGAIPGSYLTEPGARRYQSMKYGRLEEVLEPGHSLPELLSANRPDMGTIDFRGGTETDLTHRREPWHPYLSVLWSPDWRSPASRSELACLREKSPRVPETVATEIRPEYLLGYSSYGGSHRLSLLIQANAADPFALHALGNERWQICACSLVRGYDAPPEMSEYERLEGDFCR